MNKKVSCFHLWLFKLQLYANETYKMAACHIYAYQSCKTDSQPVLSRYDTPSRLELRKKDTASSI